MLHNVSIRIKLTLIIMITCIAALLLAGIGFVVVDRQSTKQSMVQEISVVAQVVASRSTAAITFDDQGLALENLKALAAKTTIEKACIYRQSKLFACYTRPGKTGSALPQEILQQEGFIFTSDFFYLAQPIVLENNQIGTLYISANLEEFHARLRRQILVGMGILLLSGVLAFLLSNRLQRIISHPISELSRTAVAIANGKNYGLRAALPKSRDEVGHLVGAFNNMLDQIEVHDAELRESEKHFRELIEASPVAMAVVGEDEDLLYLNNKFVELFGYTLEDTPNVGAWWLLAYPDEKYRSSVKAEWYSRVEKAMEEDVDIVPQEAQVACKDGSVRHIHFRGAPLGRLMVVVFTDITERVQAEKEKIELIKQLRQSQKMEAVGTLAGGIAHDFNNILAIIIGYADLISEDSPKESPVLKKIKEVQIAAGRAKDLVKQILTFSRRAEQKRIPLKLQSLVKETIKLLRSAIPVTVKIIDDIDPQCGAVEADSTQINQIIMNLCTNAVHAMDEKGVLEVTLHELNLDAQALKHQPEMVPGEFVQLSVSDSGSGIDEKIIDLIFDPFFTTKEMGKGTGMGLSVVYGIVESHKGMITVESEVGKGTSFHVFLPKIEKEVVESVDKLLPLPGGNEKILIVDDESAIADYESRALERLGYHVTVKTSSIEALETFKSSPENFNLVISDQTMPEMSGGELAIEILKIRPDMPIILCTGYSNKMSGEEAKAIGIKEFCLKPLDSKQLAITVRKCLDEK